jgi:uncharacterized membrane protein
MTPMHSAPNDTAPHWSRAGLLEALPGAVVAAIVLPVMAKTGSPAFFAIGATVAVMAIRRNEFLALAAGLTVAAMARAGAL